MVSSDDSTVRRRILVRGRVQGVGYRAFVAHHAQQAALAGTVRNTSDGDVECILEGDAGAVSSLIEKLRDGPALARVNDLDVAELDATGERGFRVVP